MQRHRCIVINRRSALTLIVIFVLSGIRQSQSDLTKAEGQQKETNNNNNEAIPITIRNNFNDSIGCPAGDDMDCSSLHFPCIRCSYQYNCQYGKDYNISCSVVESVGCKGERTFQRQMNCRYCYQTEVWQQACEFSRNNCNTVNDYYKTNCTVHPNILCLGNRFFSRNVKCNFTQGYRWSTALIISLTLGGFGVDRFYLGHWQEGIGKLFSFGGLGVWTIIDVLLISLHYLGPADGSLYL